MGEKALIYINELLGPGSFVLVAVCAVIYFIVKKLNRNN